MPQRPYTTAISILLLTLLTIAGLRTQASMQPSGTQVTASRCDADQQQVTVSVEITVKPQILGIVPGLGSFTLSSTETAHPVTGGNGP